MNSTPLPSDRIARITGFGMRSVGDGYVFQPETTAGVWEAFQAARQAGRKVVLRGVGRSYGDASVAPEQVVIDISKMRKITKWDSTTGLIECEGGVTIEDLWRRALPDGWWPPVVSGTMFPTLAGALGMNIHGKNAFEVGTLGEHVLQIEVVTPAGEIKNFKPSDLHFASIITGAGLLAAITRVTIQMKKVPSGELDVTPVVCKNWDEQFAAFEKYEIQSDYMVSWVDAFGAGSSSGRGLFHAGTYAQGGAETLLEKHQDLPAKILGVFPKSQVWRFLKPMNHRFGMRFVNAAKFLASKMAGSGKTHRQSLVAFSFLLDYVPNWRWAYLPGGFIQYQTFVPKEHAGRVFAEQFRILQEAKQEPLLAVMKRHRSDRLPFLFGHQVDGYSLALDFKVTDESWPVIQGLCHRLNDLVLGAGGRFYFAKDSTLRPSDVSAFVGAAGLERYRAAKAELDPEGLLTSGLAERVGLVG